LIDMPGRGPSPDPNSPSNPLLWLRAEGWLGLVRSALTVAACVFGVVACALGTFSRWWLLILIPLGLFNALEVLGFIMFQRLPAEVRSQAGEHP
jgi:hypothetical protein